MTVAPSSWERSEQASSKNRKSKTVSASAGTGLQVVAVLFAVRLGYKLARSGRPRCSLLCHRDLLLAYLLSHLAFPQRDA